MLSGRRATAFMALVALLLLSVIPTTTAGAVAADEGSYVDYFLGDLFQNPGKEMEPKTPRFRPWQIFNVSGQSGDGVLAFNCAGDVPTLNFFPRSDHPKQEVHNINGNTCGGGGGTTPVQYKFSRPDKAAAGYSALFWARPGGVGEENGPPLMPVPKLQLKAILKALAAMMEPAWRDEKGEAAMPESVPFPADTVAFYVKELGWLVVMGREDVEFRKPWEKMERKMGALTLGAAVV